MSEQPLNRDAGAPRAIDAGTLRHWMADRAELALLDAREMGEFAQGHPFWAVPCPLSEAAWRAPKLLPRRGVRLVVEDAEGGEAARLAALLGERGYSDVSLLEGGVAAWRKASGEVFSGVNVPSKAFGEWVEHEYETESIEASELKRWQDAGAKLAVLDARTFEEYRRMHIPRGISVPGGELVYRIGDLVPDPETIVVVNCAGRTRSILGAESLRRAGTPNRVVALRNGTMGWELADLACERGAARTYEAGTPRTASLAHERALSFAERSGVRLIEQPVFSAFAADTSRTLYALDVRNPAEYRAGHVPGSLSAPGGQLVQAADRWIAVRGARIALLDDTGTRALMAAGWLRQMGFRDVFVVERAMNGELEAGAEPRGEAPRVPVVTAETLKGWLEREGTLLLDCAKSTAYREGHIPGAVWVTPSQHDKVGAVLSRAKRERVVVTAPDGWLARHATAMLGQALAREVHALMGGTAAWLAAGRALVASPADPPDARCIDVSLRPYDRVAGVPEAMRAYLAWEVGLRGQVAREETVEFRREGPRAGG